MSDLPVCPGCGEVIGHGELQHRVVCEHKGNTWHNGCAFEARGLDKAEAARRCPHCYAHSRWLPEVTGPTTKRLCHGCGRVFDGPHAPVDTEAEP